MKSRFADELIALSRQFSSMERDSVCCGTVTVAQCLALQHLMNGPKAVGELAEDLGVSISASTHLIDGMAKRGWLGRERDPANRRRVLVHLSPEGQSEAKRLRALTEDMVEGVLAHIPAEEHASVLRALNLVREAVSASAQGTVGCC